MTKEEIEKLEPSKERVMKQLDDLGVMDEHERDCFHKGVLFAKGFYREDFEHLQALIENKNAYIETLEREQKKV